MNDNAEREEGGPAGDVVDTNGAADRFILRLYVTGTTPRSAGYDTIVMADDSAADWFDRRRTSSR